MKATSLVFLALCSLIVATAGCSEKVCDCIGSRLKLRFSTEFTNAELDSMWVVQTSYYSGVAYKDSFRLQQAESEAYHQVELAERTEYLLKHPTIPSLRFEIKNVTWNQGPKTKTRGCECPITDSYSFELNDEAASTRTSDAEKVFWYTLRK